MSNDRAQRYCDKLTSSHNTCDPLFTSREDMNRSMSKLYKGNLGVLGKMWIYTLKMFLLGFQCPIVARTTMNIPKCNPKRESESNLKRYTELSISDYNCPQEADNHKSKVIFNTILPYVTKARQNCEGLLEDGKKELSNTCDKIKDDASKTGERIENYFRGDENLDRRRQLLAGGGMLGFLKPGGLPTRLFCAGCGLSAMGMLCFPKETKETFRGISYHIGLAPNFKADKKPLDKQPINKELCKSTR